ncbi:MAG: hypothetical protein GQ475_02630 [Methylococcaceae bacterium]|nr:hypothetical protein [Methylococcaceae bacterium]
MKWLLISLLFFLSACSGLPKPMRGNAYLNLHLNTVQTNMASYQNKAFLWGGTVINVVNEKDSSQIQLLFYPINRYGRPQTDRKTEGRFAITSPLFLDPAVYKEGIEVTVTGILSGEIKQLIGKKTLTLPLLSLENIHIWPELQQIDNRVYLYPYPPHSPYYFPYHRHNGYFNYHH